MTAFPDPQPRALRTLLEDAHHVFMQGSWEALGITDEADLALRDRMRRHVDRNRTIPSHLLFAAARVWDTHKVRIVEEWEQAMEDAAVADHNPLYPECNTCPACGCPGMD